MNNGFTNTIRLALVLAITPISALATGEIQFDPSNSAADNAKVQDALDNLHSYDSTGRAVVNWANDPGTVVNVVINSSATTSTTVNASGHVTVYLNSNENQHFLDNTSYNASVTNGETPPNKETVLAHELAHGATAQNHDNWFDREQDATLNYENDIRAASSASPRTTYGGDSISNNSAWESFKDWFTDIFE